MVYELSLSVYHLLIIQIPIIDILSIGDSWLKKTPEILMLFETLDKVGDGDAKTLADAVRTRPISYTMKSMRSRKYT